MDIVDEYRENMTESGKEGSMPVGTGPTCGTCPSAPALLVGLEAENKRLRGNANTLQGNCIGLEAEIKRLHNLVDKLRTVMDATKPFLVEPPEGLADNVPYGNYALAGNCRALNKAYLEVVKEISQKGCRRCADCPESSHHWLVVCQPQHDYDCKHCDAIGKDCPECSGEGCDKCKEEGVLLMSKTDAEVDDA